MSDTITTTKQKDPKKVEAGRRLGQMSKQMREQKMRARIEEENKTDSKINYNYLIGFCGLLLTAISIYYTKLKSTALCHTPERHTPGPEPEPETVSIAYNSKLDRL